MSGDGSSDARRWVLVVSAAFVQIISGSVYAMGAWQSALRDGLDLPTEAVTSIGASTFMGSVVAMFGGKAFDALGPRVACALGGVMNTVGYCLIGLTLVLADSLPPFLKLFLPMVGSAFAGYSSVSLLDNVVCMACSLSFPQDRAAIVGYLKAVLAAAAGLWALLWVHVFKDGPGLIAYIGFVASVAFVGTACSLFGLRVLLEGDDRRKFSGQDSVRLAAAIGFVIAEALFCVAVSFCYSSALPPLARVASAAVARGRKWARRHLPQRPLPPLSLGASYLLPSYLPPCCPHRAQIISISTFSYIHTSNIQRT